jgi:endonuclease III
MFKFIKSEYLEMPIKCAYCRKNNKKDYNLLKSIPGIGGYLASVILAECGDLRRSITKDLVLHRISPGMYNSGVRKCLGITPRSRSTITKLFS